MADPFSTAVWSMGYGAEMAPPPPMRRPDGSVVEQPGNDRAWWEDRLSAAAPFGLTGLQLHAARPHQPRFWGASALHEGRPVSVRLPRYLERRGGDDITDEIMVTVSARALPATLGIWVIESPAKWFRGRRAWALNRPAFATGDVTFDAETAAWAWDCSEGPDALRTALAPLLPTIRQILDTQTGAIVTDSGVGTWIPFGDVDDRLPALLQSACELAGTFERPGSSAPSQAQIRDPLPRR